MTKEKAAELIENNLAAIYGYAFSKLYDKSAAEDLSSEIIVEILSSAEKLRYEEAFWGFAWKIAENTFRKFIRRRSIIAETVSINDENFIGTLTAPDDSEEDEREDTIYRLRRELSLLGNIHRSVCVSYYVENKSCSVIADELGISVAMVKQHLFNARNKLKEGMNMERKLGKKSYDPGTFRLGFWGDRNYYNGICKRKLPGAILLATYNAPMTAEELSEEVGVAMPYLEEEIEILEASGLLIKRGKRYEPNLVILTSEFVKKLEDQIKDGFNSVAETVFMQVKENLPKIRTLDFHGNDYDDNRLLMGIMNIALVRGFEWSNYISPEGEPKELPLGGVGYLYGFDNAYVHNHFNAVTIRSYNKSGEAWFSAENYVATLDAQHFEHFNFDKKIEAMCDAVLGKAPSDNETLPWLIENGFIRSDGKKLTANFPVFEDAVFEELLAILKPTYEYVADCMIKTSENAGEMLAETAPAWLHDQCSAIASICFRLDVAAYIMEALIEKGSLTVPKEKTPIFVFGVKI